MPKWLLFLFFIPSLIGFSDSTYLAAKHYQGVAPPCGLVEGCDVVTLSEYATIGGVSVALLGAIYYLSILLLSVAYFNSGKLYF